MNFRKAILIYLLKITNEIVAPLLLIFLARFLLRIIDPSIIKPFEIEISTNVFTMKGKMGIIDLIIVIF